LCVSSQTCLSPSVRTMTAPLMGLGNQFRQLPLGFSNSQLFHAPSVSRNLRTGKPKQPPQYSAKLRLNFAETRFAHATGQAV
jgi:hypothetical protein